MRSTLIEGTGRSQPTVTRAVSALIGADLVRERPDLSTPTGPGRPTIPLELATSPWIQIGVAVGTKATYIGAVNSRGAVLREQMIDVTPSAITVDEFIEIVATHTNNLAKFSELPIANFGMTTSGVVTDTGMVTAPNLGWENTDVVSRLRRRIHVPITVTSVITAIAGAEQQAQSPARPARVLVFYADDSIGAAVASPEGVQLLPVRHLRSLEDSATNLAAKVNPAEIVLAGSAFEVPTTARAVGRALRQVAGDAEIRVIPTHLDNARAAARAVALDRLINDPLGLAKRLASAASAPAAGAVSGLGTGAKRRPQPGFGR